MLRYPSSLLFLTAALSLPPARARAQTDSTAAPAAATAAAPEPETAPIFTASGAQPAPAAVVAPSSGGKPQIRSPELATAVTSGLPHYEPPKSAAIQAAEQTAALRDTDIPRNHIVRLPKYEVKEDQSAENARRKIPLTPQQKADLAMKQYVIDTKDMSPFAAGIARALFQDYATQEYEDAERAKNMADLSFDAKEAALSGDDAGSAAIKAEAIDLYMRHQDWAAPIPTNRPNQSTPR
jgi:hypothetical protein